VIVGGEVGNELFGQPGEDLLVLGYFSVELLPAASDRPEGVFGCGQHGIDRSGP
jgi:hypothetical protein